MIISKDLFIFGEQIFATIIPEGGAAAQSAPQQQQQPATITTTATATPVATAAAAAEKTGNNKILTGAATAAAEIIVDPLITTKTTTTTAAPTAIKLQEQETVVVAVVAGSGGAERKKMQKFAKDTTTTTTPITTTTTKTINEKVRNYKNNEHFSINNNKKETMNEQREGAGAAEEAEKILKVKELGAVVVVVDDGDDDDDEDVDEEEGATTTTIKTEKEPLVRRFMKIKPATTTANCNVESSSLKLLVGEKEPKQQQQQQQQSADCRLQLEFASCNDDNEVLYVPTTAIATTTTTTTGAAVGATTPLIGAPLSKKEKILLKNSNSLDLSQKMQKKVLLSGSSSNGNSNTVSNDHAMVTFPFISEQQRALQLTFQNINVVLNDRKILDDVSGLVSPGEVLAIMGPSGCGKTTLLDCLSGQRRIDGGSIYLNREPLSKKWRRKICYVLQEEIFFTGLTLRETVMYTALLRLPEKMPREEKMKLVDRILEALELNFCQQTKFGDYLNRGLSGGEKKRANIACELLTNPLLMLLDEPTSGLDSHSAISLMKILKRYAIQEQKTVVITVHQPSSQMFHMFDKLLLLYGGRTAYFGEVKNIYSYFEDIGVAIKPHYNPADFVLEQIKSYPDIREKLFIAAKESHSNFINRNCITVNTKNQHHNHHSNNAIHNNHKSSTNSIDAFTNTTSTTTTTSTDGLVVTNKTNGTSNDKCHHHPRDALINDIIHSYYKDIKSNHSLSHNHHNHHINHEDLLLMNNHHNCATVDEEVSQQLWCAGAVDSQSTFSNGSSDCHQYYEMADDWLDYPTRFHTQFRVLSSRNFKEAKPRMLSKLNWFQTIGLALMAGAIWFQIPRTEEFLHDLQGWMFFSQTYWMLFALFGALNSFPSEREVISKERRSGAYRLSAYYLAKMFGELPLVITLPTVYLLISYPMLGCTSFKLFFLMLVFLLLNTIVAQSVGFFIGACCMDMNVSITLSALYTLATQLFGGYLSSRIPDGLSWIRYTSMIHYAYQNMQILEFREGRAIRCGDPSSYEICKNSSTIFIPYQDILRAQNSTSPLWLNTLILMMFFLVFRGLGYAVLRYVRCPKT